MNQRCQVNEERLLLAELIVRVGHELATSLQRESKEEVKLDAAGRPSFVTVADKAVEAVMRSMIQTSFPEDVILAEEEGSSLPDLREFSGCVWVGDPIDGTENYARNIDPWACSLAIIDHAGGVAGSVSCGRSTYSAWPGSEQVKRDIFSMKSRSTLKRPLNQMVVAFEEFPWLTEGTALLERIWKRVHATRTLSSAIGQCIYVLEGRLDAYINTSLAIWDLMALVPILERGGIKLVRWDGTPILPHAWEVVTRDVQGYVKDTRRFDAIAARPEVCDALLPLLEPYAGEVERRAEKGKN